MVVVQACEVEEVCPFAWHRLVDVDLQLPPGQEAVALGDALAGEVVGEGEGGASCWRAVRVVWVGRRWRASAGGGSWIGRSCGQGARGRAGDARQVASLHDGCPT